LQIAIELSHGSPEYHTEATAARDYVPTKIPHTALMTEIGVQVDKAQRCRTWFSYSQSHTASQFAFTLAICPVPLFPLCNMEGDGALEL